MRKMTCMLVLVLLCAVCMIACAKGHNNQVEADTAGPEQTEELTAEGDIEVTYEQITQEAAKQLMVEEEGYIILDVRTKEEYATGHILGAICVPNESIGEEMPAELPDKEQLILVYCRSGNRSKQASKKLAALGYTNVKEFGGIMTWDGEIEQ